jgi:hypothetical protein
VGEGRSWIRGSQRKFDVIQMTLVDTWASTSAGAFALSENNLYTVEAFEEYFDHLTPDGIVAITRWEFARPREALRVVSQAIAALHNLGIDDVRKHFVVIADDQLNERGQRVTVIAKRTPVTVHEEAIVLRHVQSTSGIYPLYTPYVYGQFDKNFICSADQTPNETSDCIQPVLADLAQTRTLARETTTPFLQLITLPGGPAESPRNAFVRDYPFEIAPVTDNAPFFFFTFKTRLALRALLERDFHSSADWKNNVGLVVLGTTLVVSILAVLAFLIGPLLLRDAARREPLAPLLYFVAIGLGYILVEIAVIQRFVLFLGHPTYALTVVVFLMLLSSGLGSVASRRCLRKITNTRFILMAITAVIVLYCFALQGVLNSWVGWTFPNKLLVSAALLLPIGFLMGMPFPTGLRAIAECKAQQGGTAIEWAWALNAASGVLGSVLAITISLQFGFNATLAGAGGAYLLAAAFTLRWRSQQFAPADVGTQSETKMDGELVHV